MKLLIRYFVNLTVILLNRLFDTGQNRFYVLEEIARIPYFSYVTVIQLLQWLELNPSLHISKLHFKQTINETWHLIIMKELGGNKNIIDVLFAKSLGLFYYWFNIVLFLFFPKKAYYLMELVENHAQISYSEYITSNEVLLKSTKAGRYGSEYFFAVEDQMNPTDSKKLNDSYQPTLFDVYSIILTDEVSHSTELHSLQEERKSVSS